MHERLSIVSLFLLLISCCFFCFCSGSFLSCLRFCRKSFRLGCGCCSFTGCELRVYIVLNFLVGENLDLFLRELSNITTQLIITEELVFTSISPEALRAQALDVLIIDILIEIVKLRCEDSETSNA